MRNRWPMLALLICSLALPGRIARADEATATPAAATPTIPPPLLSLPTPPGERWRVIQGYNCGTHDGWDRFSFDLANSAGRSEGAPVRAAADGEWWHWVEQSGTLILKHQGGYYSMYTHLRSHRELPRGAKVAGGELIGTVGNVGAPQVTPHLHFTLFANAAPGGERQPVPLRFRDAGDFPDDGSCNQHGGAILAAPRPPLSAPPARPGLYLPPGAALARFM